LMSKNIDFSPCRVPKFDYMCGEGDVKEGTIF
jgi:hypothetical protein